VDRVAFGNPKERAMDDLVEYPGGETDQWYPDLTLDDSPGRRPQRMARR
jgi:hypothetical protein